MSSAFVIAVISSVIAAAMAFFVGLGARRSLAHWLFSAGMILLAFESLCVGLASDAITPAEAVIWIHRSLIAQAGLTLPWLAFSLVYARGNPKAELVRHLWLLIAAAVLWIASLAIPVQSQLVGVAQTGNVGVWSLGLGHTGLGLMALSMVLMVAVVMNLERTFRASVGTMRWRIKFMILGLGILFVTRAYTSSQVVLFRVSDLSLGIVNNAALVLCCLITVRSLLRAGNFDVSVYPSQKVLANSFTVMLAGIYLVVVGLLAKAMAWLGGDSGFALKTFAILVAVVLLATLLLSDRVRLHTRQFISRNFQRPVHDYRAIWERVTQATARCVRQEELCSTVARLTSEIFQSLSVSMWLVNDRREKLVLAASTSVIETAGPGQEFGGQEAAELISSLASSADAVDIDRQTGSQFESLRRLHPDQFKKGGNRICVPILDSGVLLGVLILGDRVGGVPFRMQDLDLLKSIAGHTAAGLMKIQLSDKLGQARQLEAFQAMSAFFVHDLKNTASTLSLMLKNFPVHYQDPAFREDALRGISRTVDHINSMIARLNLLRHELSIQAVECDLNELVQETLKTYEQAAGAKLIKTFNDLPRLRLDPAQFQKVLTNLLINSREALQGGPQVGRILIETSRQDGWAILTVSDNGCGMSREFMQASLFRPFQTTKKRGMGIGMFHCKMIVEAHNGRIEVDSEVGKGTSFRVLLPIGNS